MTRAVRSFGVALCLAATLVPSSAESVRRPNIVLILADDLGWSDVACYGADLFETPVSAVRMRNWKLREYLEDGRFELYNLRADPSERNDLAARMSDRTDAMARRLHEWRRAVDAAMPTPNPDFTGTK